MESPEKKSEEYLEDNSSSDIITPVDNKKDSVEDIETNPKEDPKVDPGLSTDTTIVKTNGTIPKSSIPGLSAEDIRKNLKKIKEKKKKEEKRKEEAERKREEVIESKQVKETARKGSPKKIETCSESTIDDFVFDDTILGDKTRAKEGEEFSPKSKELLTPGNFSSRSAKTIQKEELWKKSLINTNNKRVLSPTEDGRNIRVRFLTYSGF